MAQATTTFLSICRRVSRESGVVHGVKPASVIDQTDQMLQIVEWVRNAWVYVQTDAEWPWRRKDFLKPTIADTFTYTPSSWSLTDHSQWVTGQNAVSIYSTVVGVSDEGFLRSIPYDVFRSRYIIGSHTADRPTEYTVSHAGALLLGPTPNDPGAVQNGTYKYQVRGEYIAAPQVLSADTNVPTGLPEEFVSAIVYKALQSFSEHDEAAGATATWARRYAETVSRMRQQLLPQVILTGSLL